MILVISIVKKHMSPDMIENMYRISVFLSLNILNTISIMSKIEKYGSEKIASSEGELIKTLNEPSLSTGM